MMRLCEILKPENIKIPIVSSVKTEAIGELVTLLGENHQITDPQAVAPNSSEAMASKASGPPRLRRGPRRPGANG